MGDAGLPEPLAEQPSTDISALPISILANNICANLDDIRDLVSFSSSCTLFGRASIESKVWASLSERRWGRAALNLPLFRSGSGSSTADSRVDYKSLFLRSNGWRHAHLLDHSDTFAMDSGIAAVICEEAPDGTACGAAISTGNKIELFNFHNCRRTTHTGMLLDDHDVSHQACSIAAICHQQGIAACGSVSGDLLIVKVPVCDDNKHKNNNNLPQRLCKPLTKYSPQAIQSYPITCLHYAAESKRLFSLWDRGECGKWRPTDPGCARVFSIDSGSNADVPIAEMREILDFYELCTILPVNASGNEVIGASVKVSQDRWLTGACPHCMPELPASLCHHQHRSAAAAIITFDVRSNSPGRIVDRHAMPHRSFYPKMQIVREHYIMASHAGAPLVFLDRRRLNEPVAQVEDWPGVSLEWSSAAEEPCRSSQASLLNVEGSTPRKFSEKREAATPFTLGVRSERRLRRSNALCLSAYKTAVAGRAENGDVAIWDISRLLGWQDGTPVSEIMPVCGEEIAPRRGPHLPVATALSFPALQSTQVERAIAPRKRAEVWLGNSWLAVTTEYYESHNTRPRAENCLVWSTI